MVEITKAAKHMGIEHPRVLRRIDPVPAKPTPKKGKKGKPFKPYGFTYEHRRWQDGLWVRRNHWDWYETTERRDQALQAFRKQHAHKAFYRNAIPTFRIK